MNTCDQQKESQVMPYEVRVTEEEFTKKLTEICRLITIVVDEAWGKRTAEFVQRTRRPGQSSLPKGYCTFTYACHDPIVSWRYIHGKDEWIPVCRSHRGSNDRTSR